MGNHRHCTHDGLQVIPASIHSWTIDNSMSYSRWRIIKRLFKLNNNMTDNKKKGDEGYDPCSKYDFIYKVLVHNMNYVTKTADLDATIDESTWGFGGYSGECGWRLINKPVSRGQLICNLCYFSLHPLTYHCFSDDSSLIGGQVAMLFDINH